MDDLALNPWPEYSLNVTQANPNELTGSASPSQPCLWPPLLQAATDVGEKEGFSRRERGTLSLVTRRLGDAWEGVCKQRGHVHESHVGAWPAEPPKCRGESSDWENKGRGGTSKCSHYIFSPPSSLQRYRISKHGREKSICPSWSTASVSIQRRCMS